MRLKQRLEGRELLDRKVCGGTEQKMLVGCAWCVHGTAGRPVCHAEDRGEGIISC